MADLYISSVAWTAIAQFAISTAYTVGQIVRALAAPAFTAQHAFRCTTAGTSAGTEPSWTTTNNGTTTTGTAVFTCVTAQSTYGWTAAAGNIYMLSVNGNGRIVAGDRCFLSSDHAESSTNTGYQLTGTTSFTGIKVISVSRAGSVPPVAADITSGAAITYTGSGSLTLDCYGPMYWSGITFTLGGSGTSFFLASAGVKQIYLLNCQIIFTTSSTTAILSNNDPVRAVLDSTSVKFNAVGQSIKFVSYMMQIDWINTATPLGGGTVPTSLFLQGGGLTGMIVTMRGVDLSLLTTTLYTVPVSNGFAKFLLDSCRIASGLTRLGVASVSNAANPNDEVDLVNCYNGTSIISERHTAMGDVTWETTIVMTGGAQDDVGGYALKMFTGTRSDIGEPLDTFWLDVENTLTSSTHTATVEILSASLLNNNDVHLVLFYEGTSGSSLAAQADSLATILTPTAALSSSAASWGSATNALDPAFASTTTTLSNSNLTVTAISNAALYIVRTVGPILTGKLYFEATIVAIGANNSLAVGIGNVLVTNASGVGLGTSSTANSYGYVATGSVYTALASQGSIGTYTTADVICVAVDIANKKVWFRKNGGNWDNNGTHNPATNVGGFDITTLLANNGSVFPMLQTYNSTDSLTLNVGSTSFAQTAPSGFSGLTTTANLVPQYLQASFAPRQAGRLRGQIRLGKTLTDVWVNPQMTVA